MNLKCCTWDCCFQPMVDVCGIVVVYSGILCIRFPYGFQTPVFNHKPINDWCCFCSISHDSKRYCWWKKSWTSCYIVYPTTYRVLDIPGGAGFLPSTVWDVYNYLDCAIMFNKELWEFPLISLGRWCNWQHPSLENVW